ncbi:hypothetical protein PILCRDRAFT_7366 [Piloderma croceum F 1598]|uniref:Uncharacterized protein n=1 Tax=Piloderma croceum (strain F 1598) TaxID=765440 RepID=A0A0C3FT55_PILCF|nr:hypothetical protein PILCRDRAFT_7366 [Piloderma croceum F 1598]
MLVHSRIPPIQTVREGCPIDADAARDSGLPQMYEVFNHLLRLNRRSIVYLADMTIEGRLEAFKVESHQCLPGPGLDCAKRSGAVCINLGEMVFIRDIHRTGDLKDDQTHSWTVPKSCQTDETRQKVQDVTRKIIGDRAKCTLEKAKVGENGTYIGGPEFERHERAVVLPQS